MRDTFIFKKWRREFFFDWSGIITLYSSYRSSSFLIVFFVQNSFRMKRRRSFRKTIVLNPSCNQKQNPKNRTKIFRKGLKLNCLKTRFKFLIAEKLFKKNQPNETSILRFQLGKKIPEEKIRQISERNAARVLLVNSSSASPQSSPRSIYGFEFWNKWMVPSFQCLSLALFRSTMPPIARIFNLSAKRNVLLLLLLLQSRSQSTIHFLLFLSLSLCPLNPQFCVATTTILSNPSEELQKKMKSSKRGKGPFEVKKLKNTHNKTKQSWATIWRSPKRLL